jgi:hypothetical protein
LIIPGGYNPILYEPISKVGNNAIDKLRDKSKSDDTTNEASKKTDVSSVDFSKKETEKSNDSNGNNLNDAEKKQVEDLKKIEKLVITHEQAHLSAGGGLVRGGATYNYQTGPDGNRYIVGGEVQIDTSTSSDDPNSTISKMQRVIQAALAPADPSPQDRSVAANASKAISSARMELSRNQAESYKSYEANSSKMFNAYA